MEFLPVLFLLTDQVLDLPGLLCVAMQRTEGSLESLILVEYVDIIIYPRVKHAHGLLFLTERFQMLNPHQKLSFDD